MSILGHFVSSSGDLCFQNSEWGGGAQAGGGGTFPRALRSYATGVGLIEPKFLDFNIQKRFLRQNFTLLIRI